MNQETLREDVPWHILFVLDLILMDKGNMNGF